MKSLAIRCQLCGNENLFPVKYAGRTLSCSHCGESLPVNEADGSPVLADPAPATTLPTSTRESGLRRLTKAACFGLCMLCLIVLGVISGGWGGLALAFRVGVFGYILMWVTCPAGGFFGLWLARWLGQGLARLMSTYRLTLPGVIAGICAGVVYWSQTVDVPYARLTAAQLALNEWVILSYAAAIGGLLLAFLAMCLDALVNFTR